MPRNAIDAIAPAFDHMKQQLFRPFRRGHWVRLALLGLATGELSSSGGCNTNFGNWNIPSTQQPAHQDFVSSFAGFPHPELAAGAIAAIIVLGLAFIVVFAYISSVCRFMLFETVLTRECTLGEQWRRWREPGFRYFLFNLLLGLIVLGGLAILIGVPALFAYSAGAFREPKAHIALLVVGGALVATLVFAFMLTVAVVGVFTKDFVIPQMALEGITLTEAWRRLRRGVDAERGSYAGYVGMKIVLAIAAAFALAIVSIIFFIILLIPAIAIGVMVAIMAKGAGLAWSAATIALAVCVGIVVGLALMFVFAFIGSPVTVFFPAYAMHFFADRYPPLAARLYPAPPAPPTPPPAPVFAPAT